MANGAGMESFLDKVIKEHKNLTVIDASKDISLLEEMANQILMYGWMWIMPLSRWRIFPSSYVVQIPTMLRPTRPMLLFILAS